MNAGLPPDSPRIGVFVHLFYCGQYAEFVSNLQDLKAFNPVFFFNLALGEENISLPDTIEKDFPGAYILKSPNIGKDIGGKLTIMQLYLELRLKCDYLVLIHDKTSPHVLYGRKWREELLGIVNQDKILQTLEQFRTTPQTGIVCSVNHISSEYVAETRSFSTTNDALLKQYVARFRLKNTDYHFAAGTMFWIRACIYEQFFGKYSPFSIRTGLEHGNVLDHYSGSNSHSVERVLSWIALDQGFQIKGI